MTMWKGYWMWMEKPIDLLITKYCHRWEIVPSILIAVFLLPVFLSEYPGTPRKRVVAMFSDLK